MKNRLPLLVIVMTLAALSSGCKFRAVQKIPVSSEAAEETDAGKESDIGPATVTSAEQDAELQKKIKSLVEQLGSDEFDKREAATRELIGTGAAAMGLVGEAMSSSDLEVAHRAKAIWEKISSGLTYEEFLDIEARLEEMRNVEIVNREANAHQSDIQSIVWYMDRYLPAAEPLVERLLDDPRPQTRFGACMMLAPLKNEKAFPKIAGFLEDYGKFYDGYDSPWNDSYSYEGEIALRVVPLLEYYPREMTTPVAEKYLHEPYISMGILDCGDWTEKHFDSFLALAKNGHICETYFIKVGDKRAIPIMKEAVKNAKPQTCWEVVCAMRVLVHLAPNDPDVKIECLKMLDDEHLKYAAVDLIMEMDKPTAVSILREKLSELFKAADKPDFHAALA